MGWSTELFTSITFSKQHFDHKDQVQDEYDQIKRSIQRNEEDLVVLASITEPKKYCEEDDDPMWWLQNRVKETLVNLSDLYYQEFKLGLLLRAWDDCYDKDGYAKPLPEGMNWDSSFIDGDFVRHKEENTEEI